MLCVIKTKCHNRKLAEWVFWASDMSLALQYIVTSSRLMSLSTPPCIIVMIFIDDREFDYHMEVTFTCIMSPCHLWQGQEGGCGTTCTTLGTCFGAHRAQC